MSLLQLVATNTKNKYLPIVYASKKNYLCGESNTVTNIERICDVIILEGVIIPTNIDIHEIKKLSISITDLNNNDYVSEIPFKLIIVASSVKIIKNFYYIKFDDNVDTHNNKIIIPLIRFYDISIKIETDQIFEYELIFSQINYATQFRRKILNPMISQIDHEPYIFLNEAVLEIKYFTVLQFYILQKFKLCDTNYRIETDGKPMCIYLFSTHTLQKCETLIYAKDINNIVCYDKNKNFISCMENNHFVSKDSLLKYIYRIDINLTASNINSSIININTVFDSKIFSCELYVKIFRLTNKIQI